MALTKTRLLKHDFPVHGAALPGADMLNSALILLGNHRVVCALELIGTKHAANSKSFCKSGLSGVGCGLSGSGRAKADQTESGPSGLRVARTSPQGNKETKAFFQQGPVCPTCHTLGQDSPLLIECPLGFPPEYCELLLSLSSEFVTRSLEPSMATVV